MQRGTKFIYSAGSPGSQHSAFFLQSPRGQKQKRERKREGERKRKDTIEVEDVPKPRNELNFLLSRKKRQEIKTFAHPDTTFLNSPEREKETFSRRVRKKGGREFILEKCETVLSRPQAKGEEKINLEQVRVSFSFPPKPF